MGTLILMIRKEIQTSDHAYWRVRASMLGVSAVSTFEESPKPDFWPVKGVTQQDRTMACVARFVPAENVEEWARLIHINVDHSQMVDNFEYEATYPSTFWFRRCKYCGQKQKTQDADYPYIHADDCPTLWKVEW